MMRDYLNQIATWHYVTGKNSYGEPTFSSKSISVRWEGKRRLVRDKQGQEIVSEARVFCLEPVQPGDILEYDGRDWPVITVSETPGLDGQVLYREVAC